MGTQRQPWKLHNKYWVLRHGRSKPNERGLIVSHLSNGVLEEHGLSSVGVEQAQAAGHLFLKELAAESISIDKVQIYCSPFSRTVDTANAVAGVLKLDTSHVQYLKDLRERYFGPALELKSHEHYPEIWELDEHNPLVGPVGGESVADVASRLTKVIKQVETDCQGCAVLIVSHGDPLQILQTIVNVAPCNDNSTADKLQEEDQYDPLVLSQHRSYALLTGELRRLI
eukprot:c15402_g1_i1 orf=83-763(+)